MDERNDETARRKALGAVIRALRGQWAQVDLARLLVGVSQGTISRWESGRANLSRAQLRAIEHALGVREGTLATAADHVEPQIRLTELASAPDAAPMTPEAIARHWFSMTEDGRAALQSADTHLQRARGPHVELPTVRESTKTGRWVVTDPAVAKKLARLLVSRETRRDLDSRREEPVLESASKPGPDVSDEGEQDHPNPSALDVEELPE